MHDHFRDKLDKSIAETLDKFKHNSNSMMHNEEKLYQLGCLLKVSQMQSEAKDPELLFISDLKHM